MMIISGPFVCVIFYIGASTQADHFQSKNRVKSIGYSAWTSNPLGPTALTPPHPVVAYSQVSPVTWKLITDSRFTQLYLHVSSLREFPFYPSLSYSSPSPSPPPFSWSISSILSLSDEFWDVLYSSDPNSSLSYSVWMYPVDRAQRRSPSSFSPLVEQVC